MSDKYEILTGGQRGYHYVISYQGMPSNTQLLPEEKTRLLAGMDGKCEHPFEIARPEQAPCEVLINPRFVDGEFTTGSLPGLLQTQALDPEDGN